MPILILKLGDFCENPYLFLAPILSGIALASKLSWEFFISLPINIPSDHIIKRILSDYLHIEIINSFDGKYLYNGEINPSTLIYQNIAGAIGYKYVVLWAKCGDFFCESETIVHKFNNNTNLENNFVFDNSEEDVDKMMNAKVLISTTIRDDSRDKVCMYLSNYKNITFVVFNRSVYNTTYFTELCVNKLYYFGNDLTYIFSLIPTYIKKNTILLLVDKGSIFSNGCKQQGYFIYKYLKNNLKNFDIELATVYPDYTSFDIMNIPVRNILKNKLYDVLMVINVSLSLNNDLLYKLYNIKIIDIFCGNVYILQQEDYISGKFNNTLLRPIDENKSEEIWTFPMYEKHVGYLKLLHNKPVTVIPHFWDMDIINEYIKTNKLNCKYLGNNENNKLNILIFEPNISIHKTSFVPIIISERIYRKYSDLIEGIHVYCTNQHIESGISKLSLSCINLVKFNDREPLCNVLDKFKDKNVIIISHNIMNEMNFLNTEVINLGYPIIHNCSPYKNNGLYYENEFDALEIFDKFMLGKYNKDYKIMYEELEENKNRLNICDYISNYVHKKSDENEFELNEKSYEYKQISLLLTEYNLINIIDTLKNNENMNVEFINITDCCNKIYKYKTSENMAILAIYYNITVPSSYKTRNIYEYKYNKVLFKLYDLYHTFVNDIEIMLLYNQLILLQ